MRTEKRMEASHAANAAYIVLIKKHKPIFICYNSPRVTTIPGLPYSF